MQQIKCDVCSKGVERHEGYIVSTSQLVYDPGYWKRAYTLMSAAAEQLERTLPGIVRQMSSSESDWIVCQECMEHLKANRSAAGKHFRDYVQIGKRPSLADTGPADTDRAARVASGAFETVFGRKPATIKIERASETVISAREFSTIMAEVLKSGSEDRLRDVATMQVRCGACGATVSPIECQMTDNGMNCPRCDEPWFAFR